jgi:hypothetical protein
MKTNGKTHESELGYSKEGRLAFKWCKYIETSWYVAMADITTMINHMGWELTLEYCNYRMSGNTISLNQYCKDNNLPPFVGGL